jgi:hypothetical protein
MFSILGVDSFVLLFMKSYCNETRALFRVSYIIGIVFDFTTGVDLWAVVFALIVRFLYSVLVQSS